MTAINAMFYREAKIRATNLIFIFWDVFYPLSYMLVFGVGVNAALGSPLASQGVDYNAFFLASVLGMASFGIASNTSWSFFLDRDNGIFFEMLTYPLSRSAYMLGQGDIHAARQPGTDHDHGGAGGHTVPHPTALGPHAPGASDHARRDGRLVFLLLYLRAQHAEKRHLQHRDVDPIFCVPVRQQPVLSLGAAAEVVPRRGAGEPNHVAD